MRPLSGDPNDVGSDAWEQNRKPHECKICHGTTHDVSKKYGVEAHECENCGHLDSKYWLLKDVNDKSYRVWEQ